MAKRPRIDRLDWDDWNRDHIANHAVRPEEADEVVAAEPIDRESFE